MNKEVELILLKLKIVSEEQERGMYLCDKEHSKLLLDCITNLQEENKRLRKDYGRLMQDNAYTLELEQRNEKAIEYMNNTFNITSMKEFYEHLDNIENILQGDNKNE